MKIPFFKKPNIVRATKEDYKIESLKTKGGKMKKAAFLMVMVFAFTALMAEPLENNLEKVYEGPFTIDTLNSLHSILKVQENLKTEAYFTFNQIESRFYEKLESLIKRPFYSFKGMNREHYNVEFQRNRITAGHLGTLANIARDFQRTKKYYAKRMELYSSEEAQKIREYDPLDVKFFGTGLKDYQGNTFSLFDHDKNSIIRKYLIEKTGQDFEVAPSIGQPWSTALMFAGFVAASQYSIHTSEQFNRNNGSEIFLSCASSVAVGFSTSFFCNDPKKNLGQFLATILIVGAINQIH